MRETIRRDAGGNAGCASSSTVGGLAGKQRTSAAGHRVVPLPAVGHVVALAVAELPPTPGAPVGPRRIT